MFSVFTGSSTSDVSGFSPGTVPVTVFVTFPASTSASVTLCVNVNTVLSPSSPAFARVTSWSSSSAFGSDTVIVNVTFPSLYTDTLYLITSSNI